MNSKRNLIALLLFILSAGFVGFGIRWRSQMRSGQAAPAPSPHTEGVAADLVWDFTKGSSIDAVRWPAGNPGEDMGYGQYLWEATGPAPLMVLVPGTAAQTYFVDRFQVRRKENQVVSVGIMMPCETSDAAYTRAKALNDTWRVGQIDQLESWYRIWGPKGSQNGLGFCQMTGKHGEHPHRDISIQRCYFEKTVRWYVSLSLSSFDDDNGATSQPVR